MRSTREPFADQAARDRAGLALGTVISGAGMAGHGRRARRLSGVPDAPPGAPPDPGGA